jgi:hypothetical protein
LDKELDKELNRELNKIVQDKQTPVIELDIVKLEISHLLTRPNSEKGGGANNA